MDAHAVVCFVWKIWSASALRNAGWPLSRAGLEGMSLSSFMDWLHVTAHEQGFCAEDTTLSLAAHFRDVMLSALPFP